jgi:hypothetical protein
LYSDGKEFYIINGAKLKLFYIHKTKVVSLLIARVVPLLDLFGLCVLKGYIFFNLIFIF